MDRRLLQDDFKLEGTPKKDASILVAYKDQVDQVYKQQGKRLAAIESELSLVQSSQTKGKNRRQGRVSKASLGRGGS